MKKLFCVLAAAMLCCVGLAGCGEKQDLKKVTVSEVTHSVFYAPQYVAMEKGFFEEEGLKVELTNGQGADKVMTAVLSNQVDIGLAGPEAAIYVYNEKREDYAQVFAQVTKRDGSFLVGRNPEPDFKWQDLKGKYIVGGRKGGVPEMTLEYVLKKNGIDIEKDITLDTSIQFAAAAGAFTGGTGDYVALFEPTAAMLELEGKGYVLSSIGEESGEIPYTAYFAKKSYLENNKDIVEKFTRALYRGQQWVATHTPEEVAEALMSAFPDSDLKTLTAVAKRYQEIDAWCKDPILREESLNRLQEVMEEAGELKERAVYSELVDTTFAQSAMDAVK